MIKKQISNKLKLLKILKKLSIIFYFSSPNGFKLKINFGSNVNTDIIANIIAIPVNIPKYIVGIKLDNTKIEKPNTIVIEVFKIATPTVL